MTGLAFGNEEPSGSRIEEELADIREKVGTRLGELIPLETAQPQDLHRSMRYSLLGQGKRLRPAVTLLWSSVLGDEPVAALDPACAIEMVHTASLILDDLPCMDDATLRRGKRSNHLVFGEDMAILAAVALLNRGYGVVAEAAGLQPVDRESIVALLSRGIGTLGAIGGQRDDLRSARERRVNLAAVKDIYHRKTAALFIASAEIGARIAGLRGAQLKPARAYAKNVGLAFQILDDLIDWQAAGAEVGKRVKSESESMSIVSLCGTDEARAVGRTLLGQALEALGGLGPRAEPLRAMARLLDNEMEKCT